MRDRRIEMKRKCKLACARNNTTTAIIDLIDRQVFCLVRTKKRMRPTPNHQSRIWHQFGGAGRMPLAMILDREHRPERFLASSHFTQLKLPIIIFHHHTINSQIDMIATTTNRETLGTTRTVIKGYYVLLKLISCGIYRVGLGLSLGNFEFPAGHGAGVR